MENVVQTTATPRLELIQMADMVAREKGIERDEVLASVWDQHGRSSENPRYFRIWVDEVRVRRAEPGAILVSYREWHEDQGTISARRSTAMLRSRSGGPNGLEWLHTHETWLPGDETHVRPGG